jgi:uridine kinase
MPNPTTLSWESAADRILAAAAALPGSVTIGITGPVGSGKTTLASRLSPCIVSTDHYLPNYEKVSYEERDLPHTSDLEGLARDLQTLKAGRAVDIPIWSFQTHRREGSRRVEPSPVIVCEGIHSLNEQIAPYLDLRIFIEAPTAIRWSRWESLERTGQRGWGVEVAREFFHTVAEPTFALFASSYREVAHYIVTNG